MEKVYKFWMVIGLDCVSSTSKRHQSLQEAESEAKRLTMKENKPFVVLESVNICKPKEAPIEWVKPIETEF